MTDEPRLVIECGARTRGFVQFEVDLQAACRRADRRKKLEAVRKVELEGLYYEARSTAATYGLGRPTKLEPIGEPRPLPAPTLAQLRLHEEKFMPSPAQGRVPARAEHRQAVREIAKVYGLSEIETGRPQLLALAQARRRRGARVLKAA